MAQIKYLDSRRIMGASTDTVEDNYFEDRYTSNSGWTQSGSTITVNSGVSGKVHWNSTNSTGTDYVWKSLGMTLSDTEWVARFEYKRTAGTSCCERFHVFALSSASTHIGSNSQDMLGFGVNNTDVSTDFYCIYKDGATFGESSSTVDISTSTQYYIELARTSSTNLRLKVFSDSAYTTQVGSTVNYTVPATVTSLSYLHHSSANNAYGVVISGELDNTKIWNGTTTPFTVTYKPSLVTTTGGWVELGRASASGNTIDVSNLANKRYYMILYNSLGQSTSADPNWKFNSDGGSNYSDRFSIDGGTDSTGISQTNIFGGSQPAGNYTAFSVNYLANFTSKQKLWISHYVAPTIDGASEAPTRTETVAKWANISEAFDEITLTSSATLTSGGEVVVLGYDPTDTHITNFWEEIGSATGDNITDVTLSADKKYLWFQAWVGFNGLTDLDIRFGDGSLDSSGTNGVSGKYARRQSSNGGAESIQTYQTSIDMGSGWNTQYKIFFNGFIINNSANEKVGIIHWQWIDTGDGATVAPARGELVTKWANTSGQIDHIGFIRSASTFSSDSYIKVWGSN